MPSLSIVEREGFVLAVAMDRPWIRSSSAQAYGHALAL
jgi:hypothetical protein